ncbi:MAG: DUF4197 domain-containing protein [Candidatus Delongbacteria bacterium]|nr:DUF4197 domain-containing protein [Candidatus Delongbacteria bacterium]
MLFGCAEVIQHLSRLDAATSMDKDQGLSSTEIIKGLKEALAVGAANSTILTSKKDGFNKNAIIRIPFPPEAKKVRKAVLKLGLKGIVKDFEKSLNRAAEEASKKALPIFKSAITRMTIRDGINILKGANNAATVYLRSKTEAALIAEFTPVVKRAVASVEVTKYWKPVADAYNTTTIFTGEKAVNPDLDKYITQKALDGLFHLIAEEELKIRKDPIARITDILKRVFGM